MASKNERDLEAAINDERELAVKPLFARIRELESNLAEKTVRANDHERAFDNLKQSTSTEKAWLSTQLAAEQSKVADLNAIISSQEKQIELANKRFHDQSQKLTAEKAEVARFKRVIEQIPTCQSIIDLLKINGLWNNPMKIELNELAKKFKVIPYKCHGCETVCAIPCTVEMQGGIHADPSRCIVNGDIVDWIENHATSTKDNGLLKADGEKSEAVYDEKTHKIYYPGFVCPICFKERCDCAGDPAADEENEKP